MADRNITIGLQLDTSQAEKNANRLREQMEKIGQVGSRVAMAGAAITGPALLAVKAYVDKYKESEPIAARLVALQKSLADSSERVGRVFADKILPLMEKAADIASKFATFVEANPWVAEAALNVGAILTVAGGLITAVSQVAGTFATVQALTAGAGGAGGVAGGAGMAKLGTVALYASAVILGAGIGKELGNAINRALGQDETQDPGLALRQALNIFDTQALKFWRDAGIISGETAEKMRQASLNFYGLNQEAEKAAPAVEKAAAALGTMATQAWTFDGNFGNARSRAEMVAAAYNQVGDLGQAMRIVDEYSRQASSSLRDMGSAIQGVSLSALQTQIGDLQSQINNTLAQRASQRAALLAQANEDEARAAQDHARRLAEIERTRQDSVAKAARLRDANAIDDANEAAAQEVDAENEQYAAQRAAAKKSLDLQLKQFDAETRNQVEQDRRKLAELQAAANAELAIIQQTEALKLQIYQNMLAQYQALGNGVAPGTPPPAQSTSIERTRQTVNIQLQSGQTVAQIERTIRASQRQFVRSFENALGSI